LHSPPRNVEAVRLKGPLTFQRPDGSIIYGRKGDWLIWIEEEPFLAEDVSDDEDVALPEPRMPGP
jgi:hypothetical protein